MKAVIASYAPGRAIRAKGFPSHVVKKGQDMLWVGWDRGVLHKRPKRKKEAQQGQNVGET